MGTKWKKFSQSKYVHIILNVLLIITIVTGAVSLERIEYSRNVIYMENDRGIIITYYNLYGNESLQKEMQEAFKDILSYALEANCLEDNENNQKILEKKKEELDNKWMHYKYNFSYTTQDGQNKIITNSSETKEQLEELPIIWNYKSRLRNNIYSTENVSCLYNGQDTFLKGFVPESTVDAICMDNQEYSKLVGKQMIEHMDILDYKNILLDVARYHKLDNNEIWKKLKGNTKNKKNVLTDEEAEQIYNWLWYDIWANNTDEVLPLSIALGSPERYEITFAIDAQYYTSVQEPYLKYQNEMENRQQMLHIFKYVLFYDIVAFVIVMLILCYVCGRREGSEEVHYLALDKCHVEIELLAEVVFFNGLVYFYRNYWTVAFSIPKMVTLVLVPIVTIWMMAQIALSMVRQLKGKRIFSNSVIMYVLKRLGGIFNTISQSGKLVMISVGMAVVLPVLYGMLAITVHYWLWYGYYHDEWKIWFLIGAFLIFSWLALIILVYRKTKDFMAIYKGVERVKSGDIKYQIEVNGSNMMHNLAENINSLSDGLEDAVNEKMKSEHLKTELISNVSHDIKTPLTSIITYVDLLKKEKIESEKALEYIDILDKKSQRLKYLTEDLFEAAKASSGDMSMELITLDIGSLVSQGIGEFAEKFEKSSLLVKNNVGTERYFVKADSRLLWRIFENILSNVSKYALPDSRIYIDAAEQKDTIILTVKNISAYELNITADELMERFTRGDKSRNTEGSGLGLNIAESLARLQYGEFHVEIDGDLFKSVLVMPKIKNE